MNPNATCARCGSARIIPQVRVIDHEEGYELDLNVEVYECPDAPIEKRPLYGSLRADVCADCGHASMSVTNVRGLWEAYQKSLRAHGGAAVTPPANSPL